MMKNNLFASALMLGALALMTACSNEDEVGIVNPTNNTPAGMVTLTASVGTDTRTSVGTDYSVTWSDDDQIYVWGENIYSTFKIDNTTISGGSAKFKGELTGSGSDSDDAISKLQYALYFYPINAGYGANEDNTYTIKLPASYTYGTDNSNSPMYAKFDGTKNTDKNPLLTFKHLCAMVRLQLSGITSTGTTLTLTAKGSKKIAGDAKVTIADDGTLSLAAPADNEASESISFTIGSVSEDSSDPMLFDFPIPAGNYTDGFEVTLKDANDQKATIDAKPIGSYNLTAGQILVMDKLTVKEYTVEGKAPEFVTNVADAAAAQEAITAGATSVAIEAVENGSTITIPSTTTETVTIDIASFTGNTTEEGTSTLTVTGEESSTNQQSVVINVPAESTGTLTVDNIGHVEINGGTWTKVTANDISSETLVISAGTTIDELVIAGGGLSIDRSAEVKKITMGGNVTIKRALNIAANKSMEINVGTHTLTLAYDENDTYIGSDGNTYVYCMDEVFGTLKLIGDNSSKGTITSSCFGIALSESGASFTMENITYTETSEGSYGIFMNEHATGASITIKNSTVTGKYYCVGTNALEQVGENCTITLESSTFKADETALLFNIPATLTATNCTFTGGWQGAIVRAGTATFSNCAINYEKNDSYGTSSKTQGSNWGSGNNAPAGALIIGNRGSSAYNYDKTVTLTTCTFSATTGYPAIYIDTENQSVSLTYDESTKAYLDGGSKAGTGLVYDSSNTNIKVTGPTSTESNE